MAEGMIEVERIVREVLAELGIALAQAPAAPTAVCSASVDSTPQTDNPQAPAGSATTAASTEPAPQALPASRPGELVVDSRVVTVSDLAGRLDAVRRVVVPARAVITPAARDELHRRKVALSFASSAPAQSAALPRLVLVAHGKKHNPAALVASLQSDGFTVEPHQFDCIIAATDRLAAEVVQLDALGLLLTRHAPTALCLANRHSAVRAVQGTDVPSATAAVAAVGANLLIVNPTEVSSFQLRQMTREFCRSGKRPCPDAFRHRLN